jgi:TRAP-type mannitol/chloroaromatic compound transport system substrate-binding protein
MRLGFSHRSVAAAALCLLLSSCGNEPTSVNSAAAAETTPQQTYQWKLITSWPKNLPALGTTPEFFAKIVDEMSGGRMKIRVFGANELVGGLEVFDAVSSGVAEIGHSGAYYWQGKIAGTPFFLDYSVWANRRRDECVARLRRRQGALARDLRAV